MGTAVPTIFVMINHYKINLGHFTKFVIRLNNFVKLKNTTKPPPFSMLVGKFNDCTKSCMNILIRNEKNQHWNGGGGGGLNDKSGYGCPNNICNDCSMMF